MIRPSWLKANEHAHVTRYLCTLTGTFCRTVWHASYYCHLLFQHFLN